MSIISLVDYFKEEFFIPELVKTSKEKIIEELLQPLVDASIVKNKNLVLDTLLKRETLGSTGIGKGIAIPHCRTLAVSDLNIVVGISSKGVDFQATDRKRVYLFFLIIAPPKEEENKYLPVLGKIVEIVQNSKVRRSLMKVKDYTSLIKIIGED